MLNVTVYGSCVSRDLVALQKKTMNCIDYVARQSLISAASKAQEPMLDTELSSKFQNEMLAGDFRSDAFQRLHTNATESDLILIDIIDDRFGVYPFGESYITPSAEFAQSGVRQSLQLGTHIPFGTDEHFELWMPAALAMKQSLSENMAKCFVLSAPFTDASLDGTIVPEALSRNATVWNQQYARYYDHLGSIGFNVIRLPSKMAVSTKYHQWGVAPFHYVEGAYGWWFDRIVETMPKM